MALRSILLAGAAAVATGETGSAVIFSESFASPGGEVRVAPAPPSAPPIRAPRVRPRARALTAVPHLARPAQHPFVLSTDEAYAGQAAALSVGPPLAAAGHAAGDAVLALTKEAQRYGFTAPLARFSLADDAPLVVQFEAKHQSGLSCGGSYVKLYADGVAPARVTPSSPYVIMFGPDKCGATDKVHFIVRTENPVTGVTDEHHLAAPPRVKADTLSHVYTLVLKPATAEYDVRGAPRGGWARRRLCGTAALTRSPTRTPARTRRS